MRALLVAIAMVAACGVAQNAPPDASVDGPLPDCGKIACESRLSLNSAPARWEACRDGWVCFCTVRGVRTACRYLLPGI